MALGRAGLPTLKTDQRPGSFTAAFKPPQTKHLSSSLCPGLRPYAWPCVPASLRNGVGSAGWGFTCVFSPPCADGYLE